MAISPRTRRIVLVAVAFLIAYAAYFQYIDTITAIE